MFSFAARRSTTAVRRVVSLQQGNIRLLSQQRPAGFVTPLVKAQGVQWGEKTVKRSFASYKDQNYDFEPEPVNRPTVFEKNKWIYVTISAIAIAFIGGMGYYMYLFNELVEKPLAQHYPPNVAKRVKQALYYASRNDAQSMANSFKKAIQLAEEAGLHPLSNEIAGLKIECAALLTKINDGEYKGKAVEILEKVLDEAVAGAEYFTERERWKDRSVVLQRAVLLGYKVGEMYTEMNKMRQAEEAMVWSTETLLREIHRRERDKVKEEEQGEWFDRMAVAECLEKLATHYEATNQHTLATPLYLRAATLSPQDNCHTVTLMSNLAACLSQQSPPSDSKITRKHLIEDGQKWALKALEIDATIKPPQRTPECDEACVAATMNLGEMAEMLGEVEKARGRFQEALSLAKALGMEEGIKKAEEGLKRLEGIKTVVVTGPVVVEK